MSLWEKILKQKAGIEPDMCKECFEELVSRGVIW
jgi:hypothetical protein